MFVTVSGSVVEGACPTVTVVRTRTALRVRSFFMGLWDSLGDVIGPLPSTEGPVPETASQSMAKTAIRVVPLQSELPVSCNHVGRGLKTGHADVLRTDARFGAVPEGRRLLAFRVCSRGHDETRQQPS